MPRADQQSAIMRHRVVSFHYTLTDAAGKRLDSSVGGAPLVFLEGTGQIIPGLEAQIQRMKPGEKKLVTVKARDAYGPRDSAKVVEVPRDRIPSPRINVGDKLRTGPSPHDPIATVTKATPTHVTLDSNHPLAGLDLTFAIEIVAVRDATPAELSRGPGGQR